MAGKTPNGCHSNGEDPRKRAVPMSGTRKPGMVSSDPETAKRDARAGSYGALYVRVIKEMPRVSPGDSVEVILAKARGEYS